MKPDWVNSTPVVAKRDDLESHDGIVKLKLKWGTCERGRRMKSTNNTRRAEIRDTNVRCGFGNFYRS